MNLRRSGRTTWDIMGRRDDARQLADDYAGLVSIAQAKQMLAILNDNAEQARWCCEVVKLTAERKMFTDTLDPVALARVVAKRKHWEPTPPSKIDGRHY